jgi:hypothetical protein
MSKLLQYSRMTQDKQWYGGGWVMMFSAHLFLRSLKSMSYGRFQYIDVYIF